MVLGKDLLVGSLDPGLRLSNTKYSIQERLYIEDHIEYWWLGGAQGIGHLHF